MLNLTVCTREWEQCRVGFKRPEVSFESSPRRFPGVGSAKASLMRDQALASRPLACSRTHLYACQLLMQRYGNPDGPVQMKART